MLDQDVAQSQQEPIKPKPSESNQEVDFQNSELPIDTEPASPNNMAVGDPLKTKAKVINKQRPNFLRINPGDN